VKKLEGRVRGLGKDGEAVVETDRGIVFAAGGLPGERVRLGEVRREGKILRARRLQVIEPSPERLEPPCPIATRCGGCPLMHGSERVQLEAKRVRVERALASVRRVRPELSVPITGPQARLGYRGRARLAWRRDGAQIALGLRRHRSHFIADIERCLVLVPALDAALRALRSRLAPHLVGSGEIHVGLGEGGRAVVAIETPDAPPRQAYAALEALVADQTLAGASIRAGGARSAVRIGETSEVGTDIEGRLLRTPIGCFSQAHEEMNRALGQRLLAFAGPLAGASVLELYSGHGNFTLALAARAARVSAVERSVPAVEALRENARLHRLDDRIEAIAGDAATNVRGRPGEYRIVVLDPPRSGAWDVLDRIAALRPSRIVYASCDPETLGRDLSFLAARGYALEAGEAFDMFPQTAHVETVVVMVRTEGHRE
jgi:23S rRNA (uracil1939-C5)-methyltransferase